MAVSGDLESTFLGVCVFGPPQTPGDHRSRKTNETEPHYIRSMAPFRWVRLGGLVTSAVRVVRSLSDGLSSTLRVPTEVLASQEKKRDEP